MLFSLDLIVKNPLSKFQPESLEQLNSVSWVDANQDAAINV